VTGVEPREGGLDVGQRRGLHLQQRERQLALDVVVRLLHVVAALRQPVVASRPQAGAHVVLQRGPMVDEHASEFGVSCRGHEERLPWRHSVTEASV
jgi:hypothetical protein